MVIRALKGLVGIYKGIYDEIQVVVIIITIIIIIIIDNNNNCY